MSGIEHEYTLNAVTALAFYRPLNGPLLVLAGEGCSVKVYEASSSSLVAQCQIFTSQTVHGIAVKENRSSRDGIEAVFWGGRSFVLLDVDGMEAIVSCERVSIVALECLAHDWIMDGAIAPSGDSGICVFATAHCAVLKAVLRAGSRRPELIPLSSASRSILYSAHVVWTSADSIMVAAGTMFGEIEVNVWQSIIGEDPVNLRCRHLFTFTGHEGSIFGVRISPEVITQDGSTTRLLASCSDDRTIRIWDLSVEFSGKDESEAMRHVLPSARETGFGGNGDVSISELSAKRCIAVVMAHASRIWRVNFAIWNTATSDTTQVHVLSFGEDSTCQYWYLDYHKGGCNSSYKGAQVLGTHNESSSEIYPASLNHLQIFAYHTGKHIWSAALLHVDKAITRLVTGGADGKISIYDLLPHQKELLEAQSQENSDPEVDMAGQQKEQVMTSRSWTLEEILEKLPRPPIFLEIEAKRPEKNSIPLEDTAEGGKMTSIAKKKKKPATLPNDFPNRYAFVAQNKLLVTTSFGRVLLATIEKRCHWEELKLPRDRNNDLLSYSLLLGLPDHGIAFLIGANGTIYMYSQNRPIMEISKIKGKPAGLFNISKSGQDMISILVTVLGSETAYFLSVRDPSAIDTVGVELTSMMLPHSFIVTSAGNIGDLILVGSRNGSIAVYHLPSRRDSVYVAVDQWVKNPDAITSIVNIRSGSTSESNFYFLITSRNGSYSIFSLSAIPPGKEDRIPKASLTLVHQAYPPFGPMIEDAWFNGTDLMLFGFQSKNFVVWNETKRYAVASIECGGAHRSYAYSPNYEKGSAGHFVYTKASKLYIHSQKQPSHRVMKTGGHGREIKACAHHNEFIATGAEDTTIRIWRHPNSHRDSNGVHFECCAVIEKHSTGIQHLQWCCSSEDYHNLFSAGGTEEFYVWAVSEIPGFGIGVVCEAALTDHSEDHDLRIMGFHVEVSCDNTPRKIDYGIISSINHKYHINLIYSDSTIKAYRYSRQDGFTKIAQATYTSACLTQIIGIEKHWPHLFLTAATDGYLCLWSFPVLPETTATLSDASTATNSSTQTPEFTLLSRLPVHQSSISALAIEHVAPLSRPSSKWLLIATAGDDNAIALTLLHAPLLPKSSPYTPLRRILIPSAHAAGITGLAFKPDITGGLAEGQWAQLWSVGGDQRIKRWKIEILQDEHASPAEMHLKVHKLRPEDDVWTSVADPGDLAAFHKHELHVNEGELWSNADDASYCLVVGNGMELFRLKDGYPNGDGYVWEGTTWGRKEVGISVEGWT